MYIFKFISKSPSISKNVSIPSNYPYSINVLRIFLEMYFQECLQMPHQNVMRCVWRPVFRYILYAASRISMSFIVRGLFMCKNNNEKDSTNNQWTGLNSLI